MRRFFTFICLIGLICSASLCIGQSEAELNKAVLMKELEKRNLNYEEVATRLSEEGFDIDNLDIKTMSREDQERIESILTEMTRSASEIQNEKLESKEDEIKPQNIIEPNASEYELDTQLVIKDIPVEVYGQDLFRNNIINLIQQSNQLKAPESYVLGQGDQIVVSIWGRSQVENTFTIGADGFVRVVDGRLRVYLKGLTLAEAREKLKNFLSREYIFSDGEFDVSVNYARTVRIAIYGEVLSGPGSYTVSGFNSALNALSLVGGPNNIGSLRNIKLQKASGKSIDIDVYAFMKNPSLQSAYYLEDNDIIMVPVSDKIVRITGGIRRPFKYELKSGETLEDLVALAGGFAESAYRKKIQVKRYQNNEQLILDLDWSAIEDRTTELFNGDEIYIESIERSYRNYVNITGELQKPGQYERYPNMRISDLVQKAGLTPNSNLELFYLIRTRSDGEKELFKLNLDEILSKPDGSANMILQDLDKVEIWNQNRFTDDMSISVSGAVRYNGNFPYDRGGQLRVSDVITMAGGLRRDASEFATVYYNDPLNKTTIYYKTIDNLNEILSNPEIESNITLSPFDSLVVQSKNALEEKLYVRIEGAVNNPGTYQYGEGMTIKDLLILAGGFRQSAATNNIEVSRAIVKDNEPTNIVVANLELTREYEVLSKGTANGQYFLEPYDNIAVRFIKDFNLQERVFLKGEVNVPGPYSLYESNQRIASVIQRAGGLTDEAFPEGATLIRADNKLGPIVIKLEEILNNPNSEFNFILRDGDEITIPKINEFVVIKGATKVEEVALDQSVSEYNTIRVPFHKNRDALFYINEFAGGFDENADKAKVFVEYANGEIKRSKPGLFKRKYPSVRKGATITVGYKEEEKKNGEGKSTDWSKVLSDSVGQALSILTLILLVQRID